MEIEQIRVHCRYWVHIFWNMCILGHDVKYYFFLRVTFRDFEIYEYSALDDGLWSKTTWLESGLCHLINEWLWASYFTSLCLSFLICTMVRITARIRYLLHSVGVKIKGVNTCNAQDTDCPMVIPRSLSCCYHIVIPIPSCFCLRRGLEKATMLKCGQNYIFFSCKNFQFCPKLLLSPNTEAVYKDVLQSLIHLG